MTNKIGISDLCGISGNVEYILSRCQTWGYESLELTLCAKGGNLNLDTPVKSQKKIASMIRDQGMELASIAALAEYSLIDTSGEIRQKGISRCKKALDIAQTMGADTILITSGPFSSDICYDDAVDIFIESLAAIAPHAEKAGVNIGIEQVWNKFLVSPLDLKHVIEQVKSGFVGAYIDTGNMVFWNYPEHWIKILAPYIKKIHLKDFKQEGFKLSFVQLTKGAVNWNNVMREIRASKYSGALISEVGGNEESFKETAQIIKELVKRKEEICI